MTRLRQLTSEFEVGSVARPIDVACNCAAEITYTDMESHADSAFVLTGKVVSKPEVIYVK